MSEKIGRAVSEHEPSPCVFCEIRDGKSEASFIAGNARAFAIMALEGHPLVITNNHVTMENLDDNIEEAVSAYRLAFSMLPAVREGLGVEGVSLVTNLGEAAGQDVPHLHIHLIGRNSGDRKVVYRDFERVPRETLDARAASIRNQIKSLPAS